MKDTFVEKISKKFADLSRAEEILLQAVAIGSVAECGFNEEGDGIARQTKDYCCVRAALLRWLCTDKEGKNFVDVRGIRIRAAVITGRLDLAFVTVPFPLALTQCVISEGIDITEADVRSLALDGSHCGGIAAAQLLVRGSLYLRDGFSAHGEVRLRGATIKGSLECRGGSFSHPGMEALSADGINIEGSMFMDQGFRAVGNVRLVGANIGKMLVCSGARLLNKGAEALTADGIKVGSSILFDRDFRALGEVRIVGAVITGDLSCRGGRILNRGGDALSADGITTTGSINFNRSFRAIGRVRLIGATIKRDLSCRDGHFLNHAGEALSGDRARIDGNIYFDGRFKSNGIISLPAIRVGGDLYFWNAEFCGTSTTGFMAENAVIDGKFIWKGIEQAAGTLLNLTHARVGQLADDEASWPMQGNLFLNGFTYSVIAEGPMSAVYRLRWLRRHNPHPFFPQPYEQLAQVFRKVGHDEEAIKIAIAKEDARLKYSQLDWGTWLRQWFMKYIVHYGYKPHHRALALGTLFIVLGWVVFQVGYGFDLFSPTRERVYMDQSYIQSHIVPEAYPGFNSFIYSLDAFIPFVDLHQDAYWLPNANHTCSISGLQLSCGALLRNYLWIHIGMGWVFTTLFAVGFSGLVRKA